MGKFKVISAPEFIASGPAFGSREEKLAIQAELAARDARLVEQQRQIDDYQKKRSRMAPREALEDELTMFREMTENSAENLATIEAVFEALQKGEREWLS